MFWQDVVVTHAFVGHMQHTIPVISPDVSAACDKRVLFRTSGNAAGLHLVVISEASNYSRPH